MITGVGAIYVDWVKRRRALASCLIRRRGSTTVTDGGVILTALIAGLSSDFYPKHDTENVDKKRFVQILVDQRTTESNSIFKTISLPSLINDRKIGSARARRHIRQHIDLSMPRNGSSQLTPADTTDVISESTLIRDYHYKRRDLRIHSYAAILYSLRNGYAHEYKSNMGLIPGNPAFLVWYCNRKILFSYWQLSLHIKQIAVRLAQHAHATKHSDVSVAFRRRKKFWLDEY